MIRKLILVLTLSVGLADIRDVSAEDEAVVPTSIEELEAEIRGVLAEHDVPAIGVTLVDQDGPVWTAAIGKADLATDTDVDLDSMFRIGSTSKMFVALAVLKLVEEGRLSLSDTLRDLAPEIEFENPWADTDPIRIAHLLEHTTGWDDIHLPEYAHNDPAPVSLKAGLDFHPHSRRSRWKPGSRMTYRNSGPPVAAYVVQKVTGQDFEEYVAENFFGPMGMTTMTYRLSPDVEAKGVTLYDNGNTPQDYWHIIMRPSGSINASIIDMQKMVSFFVNRGVVDGQPLVSLASLERMERAETTPAGRAGQEIGYGLHNYSSDFEHWIYRSHNGGVNGGLTELAYLPDEKLGYVFFINSGSGAAFGEISDLIRAYQTRGLEGETLSSGEQPTEAHLALEGYYQPTNSRQQTSYFLDRLFGIERLWFEDGKLLRKAFLDDRTRVYYPRSADLYADEQTGRISLSRVVDPLLGPVVHAGTTVLNPTSTSLVFAQLTIGALWLAFIALSFPFALVWVFRRWRGKIAPGPAIRIRLWPLLAGLSVVLFAWLMGLGLGDPFGLLGKPTIVSVSITMATVLFAVFAALGLRAAIEYRHAEINRAAYWYSALSSAFHFLVMLYLLYFGIIGLMTWT